jgi:hypothetical protein
MKLLATLFIGLLALGALSPGFAQSQATTAAGTGNFVVIPLQHISPELVAQLLGGVVIYDMSGNGGGYGGQGYGSGYNAYSNGYGNGHGPYGTRQSLRGGNAGYGYGTTPYQTW